LGNLNGRNHSEELSIEGRIILKRILEKLVESCGVHATGSVEGPLAGCCEDGNELSGSIKVGEFLDSMSDY
jgi:hypothetical protein